ncbi:MAG TPA: methyltransferase domain-containing protein [Vicinamibacterales bacterium]|nr:methyltransferase domain-containing protein [Vicinamibacterales bacterium]
MSASSRPAPDGRDIASHYSRGDLLERLDAALAADGVDPSHPTIEALAPYDQFHGRGMEATAALADWMPARASDRILDIGSGIGGPARYVATRFGCRVNGIDLTPEFCAVARDLTTRLGLSDRVTFDVANALALPFADATFDGVYSMNVSMNIADKAAFHREIARVLKPGGWVVLAEIAKGTGGELEFPTPWASSAATSFLATEDETRRSLVDAGFDLVEMRNTREAAVAYGARARAMVERGEKPPHRSVQLVHGDAAKAAMANSSKAQADGRLVPIEILARKRR